MVPVVGRIYRRPEYNQPWWLTALAIFGSLLGLLYFAMLAIQAGQVVWAGYSRIPYPRQLLTGRIAAMAMGLPWLSWSYWRWRERLFLAPAMRDLVTTPASPYQILKDFVGPHPATGTNVGLGHSTHNNESRSTKTFRSKFSSTKYFLREQQVRNRAPDQVWCTSNSASQY